jgi:hypothetical protein
MGAVFAAMLLQDSGDSSPLAAAVSGVFVLIALAIVVFIIAAVWKVFTKAGEPGWAVIVPIYNIIVMLKVAGKPLWWILLMIIPLVNIIPAILVPIGIAKNFGKGVGFGIGLLFLGFIFYPILAWGDAVYEGQAA